MSAFPIASLRTSVVVWTNKY